MKEKNFKISFYGNITSDNVYLVNSINDGNKLDNCYQHYHTYGGIANCVNWIKSVDVNNQFNLVVNNVQYESSFDAHRESASRAVVIVEPVSGNKLSFVMWNRNVQFKADPSDWNHIMYFDILENFKESDIVKFKGKGILSADLCLSSMTEKNIRRVLKLSKYLDYLFLSDNECYAYASRMLDCMHLFSPICNILLHHRAGCYYLNEDGVVEHIGNDVVSNKNILGAGDVFAAAFVLSQLSDPKISIKDNINISSRSVLKLYEKESQDE